MTTSIQKFRLTDPHASDRTRYVALNRTDAIPTCSNRGTMARVDMLPKSTSGRLLTALRLAFYPVFEPTESRRFQALTMEAENARGAGDLAKAEMLYSAAVAKARSCSDPSHLSRARDGLARVYQE